MGAFDWPCSICPQKSPQFDWICPHVDGRCWTYDTVKPQFYQGLLDVMALYWIRKWCPHTDLNRGPPDYKSGALPAEL